MQSSSIESSASSAVAAALLAVLFGGVLLARRNKLKNTHHTNDPNHNQSASSLWPNHTKRRHTTNAQGVKIATFTFEPTHAAKKPRGAVLLSPGLGVCCRHEWLTAKNEGHVHDKFDGSLIDALCRAGLIVHTYDHQGQGESGCVRPGVRYFFERFDDLARDLLQLHDELRAEVGAELPLFWVGSSMGGGVALRATQLRADAGAASQPTGLILLAPMISLTKVREQYMVPALGVKNRHLYPVMNTLSSWIPTAKIVKRAGNHLHPHLDTELAADALNYSEPFRVRISTEFVLITERMMCDSADEEASLHRVRVRNLLCCHSLADSYTEPEGSRAAYERIVCEGERALLLFGGGTGSEGELCQRGPAQASRVATAELESVRSLRLWHALLQEPGHAELARAISAWVVGVAARS